MNDRNKVNSPQVEEFKKQLETHDPQNLMVAKGNFPGLGEDLRVELVVYESTVKNKQQNTATLKFSNKGEDVLVLKGVVWGLLNPNTPILFRDYSGPSHGAVDVAKLYKSGDTLEGKLFPEDLSLAYKLASSKKIGNVDQKRRIHELRDDHAIGITLKIDNKLTHVAVPDNIRPTKTLDQGSKITPGA